MGGALAAVVERLHAQRGVEYGTFASIRATSTARKPGTAVLRIAIATNTVCGNPLQNLISAWALAPTSRVDETNREATLFRHRDTHRTPPNRPLGLFPLHLLYFIGLGSAGGVDLTGRLGLANQRLGERRCDRDPALLGVGLRLADDLPPFFSAVSSSTSVTVAPKVMVSPHSFETSITSARASLSSSSAIRALVERPAAALAA